MTSTAAPDTGGGAPASPGRRLAGRLGLWRDPAFLRLWVAQSLSLAVEGGAAAGALGALTGSGLALALAALVGRELWRYDRRHRPGL